MKKVLSVVAVALMVLMLAGCSRVPEEKLQAVKDKHSEMEAMYTRMEEIIDEMNDVGAQMGMGDILPAETTSLMADLRAALDNNAEIIENDLAKMKEADVDEVLAKQDEELAEANNWMPVMEKSLTTVKAIVTHSDSITEKSEKLVELLGELTETPSQEVQDAYNALQEKIGGLEGHMNSLMDEVDEEDHEAMIGVLDEVEGIFQGLVDDMDDLIAMLEKEV